jgi:hypothetical protein
LVAVIDAEYSHVVTYRRPDIKYELLSTWRHDGTDGGGWKIENRPAEHVKFLNVYGDASFSPWSSLPTADEHAMPSRKAVVKIIVCGDDVKAEVVK